MQKFNLSTLMAAVLLIGASGSAFALESEAPVSQQDESPKYVCEAGVTIPKHLMSYLGDISTSRDEAAASALEKCKKESSFAYYCRPLNCYLEEARSGN